MATFISLVNFTDQGIRNVKDSPGRYEAFKALAEKVGGSVYCGALHSTSWLRNQTSEGWIFDWLRKFLDTNYEIVGVAEIFGRKPTQYR